MHNIDSNTYAYAINQVDGLSNRLKKLYPDNFESDDFENNLEKCIDNLYLDSLKILTSEKGNKLKKRIEDYFLTNDGELYETLRKSLNKHISELEDFIENHKKENIPKLEISQKVMIMDLQILKDLTDKMIEQERKYKEIISVKNKSLSANKFA